MSKKAVIRTGSKQYLVSKDDELDVELLDSGKKTYHPEVLMLIDDSKIKLGKPLVKDAKVTAEIISPEVKDSKVTSIRYKAKKRLRKVKGHRQTKTRLKIKSIS